LSVIEIKAGAVHVLRLEIVTTATYKCSDEASSWQWTTGKTKTIEDLTDDILGRFT